MGFNCYFLHRQMCVLQQVRCRVVVHVGTPVVSCSPQSEVRRCKLGSRYEWWRNHSLWFFCFDCTVSCLWCLTSLSTSWLLSSHSHYLWQQSLLPLNTQIHAKTIYSEVQFNKKNISRLNCTGAQQVSQQQCLDWRGCLSLKPKSSHN